MNRRHRFVIGTSVLGLACVLGYAIKASASGIPATGALAYSGVLNGPSGPLTGNHNIQLAFYDAATAGNNLCQTASTPLTLSNGSFSVPLPDACTTAVGSNPNVWVDVLVDGGDTGRTKIGAVPYAVEANRASSAAGALAQQIVPSGAVVAFNLSACPSGWSTYSAAGGRAIIGVNPAGGNGLSTRNLGDTPGAESHALAVTEMPPHNHTVGPQGAINQAGMAGTYDPTATCGLTCTGASYPLLYQGMTTASTGGGAAFSLLQPSVALLYCVKS